MSPCIAGRPRMQKVAPNTWIRACFSGPSSARPSCSSPDNGVYLKAAGTSAASVSAAAAAARTQERRTSLVPSFFLSILWHITSLRSLISAHPVYNIVAGSGPRGIESLDRSFLHTSKPTDRERDSTLLSLYFESFTIEGDGWIVKFSENINFSVFFS